MWEIIKGELRYSKNGLLIFFAAIPLLVLLGILSDGYMRSYLVWFVLVLTINHWNARRINEKRDSQLAQLPVSRCDLGRARALIIMLTSLAYLAIYGTLAAVFGGSSGHGFSLLLFLWSIVVFGFSLVLMFRDRYVGTKSLRRGKIIIVFLLLAVFFAGIYTLISTEDARDTGAEPPMIVRAIGYVFEHNPLASPVFIASSLAVALAFAYLSVISFQHRKSNAE
jgi:MFS family permease